MSTNLTSVDRTPSKFSFLTNPTNSSEPPMEEEQPYNTILGYVPGHIPAYSNGEFFSMERHIMHGLFMGIKWQCVEFARRWALLKHGLFFGQIPYAGKFFEAFKYVRRLPDCAKFSVTPRPNGSPTPPTAESFILWPTSEKQPPGHIGVITEVIMFEGKGPSSEKLPIDSTAAHPKALLPDQVGVVRIGEQNKFDAFWKGDYSRELPILFSDNLYYIHEDECEVQGWMEIEGIEQHKPIDFEHTDMEKVIETLGDENDTGKGKQFLKRIVAQLPKDLPQDWLDKYKPAEAAWLEQNGSELTRSGATDLSYYLSSRDLQLDLAMSAHELHRNFMEATRQTIESDELLGKCAIPIALWSKVRKSWADHQKHYITGRFDFGYDGKELKVFAYDADNPGLLLEATIIQDKWSKAAAIGDEGMHSGRMLQGRVLDRFKLIKPDIIKHEHSFFEKFPQTKSPKTFSNPAENTNTNSISKSSPVPNSVTNSDPVMPLVHLIIDSEVPDQKIYAVYVSTLLSEVGIRSKLIDNLSNLHKQNGRIVDADNDAIRTVWKTWSWNTVFDRFEALQREGPKEGQVDLSEVLLDDDILVFEPLWKFVLSNKALLPLVYQLYPSNPQLIYATYDLTPEIKSSGYISKAIRDTGGGGLTLVAADGHLVETNARSQLPEQRAVVYQQLFLTKEFEGGWFASLGGWMVGEWFSGLLIREDKRHITDQASPVATCRIIMK